jgi:hypothetical protein
LQRGIASVAERWVSKIDGHNTAVELHREQRCAELMRQPSEGYVELRHQLLGHARI